VKDGGVAENWHGAAACVISVRASPTTMFPRRSAGAGLLAAEYCTTPSPWPEGVDEIVSHEASLDAVHVHSRAAETFTVPVPPLAAMDVPPVREIAQRVAEGLTTVLVDEPQLAPVNSTATESTVHATYLPTTAVRDARARPGSGSATVEVARLR